MIFLVSYSWVIIFKKVVYLLQHGLTGGRSLVVLATLLVTVLVVGVYFWARHSQQENSQTLARIVGRTGSIIKRMMEWLPFK
ncbi:hypothetical protein M3M39_02075 [Fructilactobacillus hinvesii]|uniref:Uncharacterized protein n=1 Tax=Fructilactobacillus hinvesii TaxID=2940300 RepID=A0ABY5BXA1_9LACO|nr:hypothetical protein [Fructilactobacillus hinvesii]USS88288.1 hypothetical protein M3M39_02075 [Fructilactobacillus hinvesii]